MKTRKKIAVLGAGKIGQTLVAGILEAKARREAGRDRRHQAPADARRGQEEIPGQGHALVRRGLRFADVVLVGVKPQTIREVLAEIDAVVTPRKLVITTVASVPTAFVEDALGAGIPVIRTMPNTPCLIRRGHDRDRSGASRQEGRPRVRRDRSSARSAAR